MLLRCTLTILWLLTIVSCSNGQQTADAIANEQAVSVFDVNQYALNKLVCDPFDPDQPPQGFAAGLKAELYYLRADQPRYTSVSQYFEHGTKSTQHLFFTDMNVPTRLFNQGFPLQTGGVIQDDTGNKLYEYFALKVTSTLKLRDDQEEGVYELALLSDDGSIFKIQQNGVWKKVVENDGNHPTRLGCGQTIEMRRGESHLIEFQYYQGPKHHISFIPLWRRVTEATVAETRCGHTGNNLYFDYNNNSKPQPAYLELLARGWEPIRSGNYELPIQVGFNPCAGFDSPKISNVRVEPLPGRALRVTWQTDMPATSQVLYTSTADSQETLTTSDNILRTQHEVTLNSIQQETTYTLQAVSISQNFGKAISAPIQIYIPILEAD